MSQQSQRYTSSAKPADGWELQRLTPPSRLFGANGLRAGSDGRLYVAQVAGSQISAIDIDSGLTETISPMGGGIVGPDDLAFDAQGNIFATEITEGRVSMLATDGSTRVICDDVPTANPITLHQGRLFVGGCRPDGRIMELGLDGSAPHILLENVPMPNAMAVGPDGKLYIPVMGANEIWRIALDGGAPEVVARDLGVPDAVKFDAEGYIVSTQVASGQVLRIDPSTGNKTVLATIAPGLDNLDFVGKRLFVSSISGQVNEVTGSGTVRPLVPDGLQWPLGLAMGADNQLFVADGGFTYFLLPGGKLQSAGMLFTPGFPGFTRGVAAEQPGQYVVTTASGQVTRWWPVSRKSEALADGFDQLMDIATTPKGTVVFVEMARGRVLSTASGNTEAICTGLDKPMGIALAGDGSCFVSETGAGKVVKLVGGRAETVVDGLLSPEGIAAHGGLLHILDTGTKALVEYDLATGNRRNIATGLPAGAPAGITPKPLRGVEPFTGPMTAFAGITAGADGTLYLSAAAEGCVLALKRGSSQNPA